MVIFKKTEVKVDVEFECRECGMDLMATKRESFTRERLGIVMVIVQPCSYCMGKERKKEWRDGFNQGLKEGIEEGLDA